MSTRLTKTEIRDALGFDTDAQLADFFGISPAAVSQWGEEAPIPELRQLQFERKRPDLAAEPVLQASGETSAMGVA